HLHNHVVISACILLLRTPPPPRPTPFPYTTLFRSLEIGGLRGFVQACGKRVRIVDVDEEIGGEVEHGAIVRRAPAPPSAQQPPRSEEHTSELQSRENLVCRLLLEKKKKTG